MQRLILITNIISPYIIPLFNHLGGDKDLNFKVVFLAETESNRKWKIHRDEIKFAYKILKGFCFFIQSKEMPIYFNFGLWQTLSEFKPDVICMWGYHYLVTIEALLYAKIKKIPITLSTESHLLSGFIKNPLVEFYKKMIIPKFNSYITCGSAAKEQIIHYGAKPEKVVVGCHAVDIDWYMRKSCSIKDDALKEMRKTYPPKNILYVGEFIERKSVFNLIKAFHKLEMDDVGLVLVGKGKEKDKYLEFIKENNIKNVFFEGFVQKEDIVKYYKLSDVFVLPSFNEVWGMVVNEAMACGLPILSSIYAGATKDLVKDGENGFGFNPNDIDELVEKLKLVLGNDELRRKMGANSLKIIKDKTPQNYAQKILEAVRYGLQKDL